MNSPTKRRRLWPRLLLALGGLLVAALLLEGGYRVKLYLAVGYTPLGMSQSFVAYDRVSVKFDRELGFSYLPYTRTTGIRMTEGLPVLKYERQYDALGNPVGKRRDRQTDAEPTILVFGDSFTAMADGGVLWTELLEEKLTGHGARNCSVMNFARDGYGILQMTDLAAAKVAELEPALVIIAFITDDLNRDRFWVLVTDEAGQPRVLTSSVPAEDADPTTCVDMGIYDSGITPDWCDAVIATGGAGDELASSLNRRHAKLLKENRLPINYLSITTSFLYNRLAHNDPFFAFQQKRPNPRFAFSDFGNDAKFVENVAAIADRKIPLLLIHLPQYEELSGGRYITTQQQRELLQSLQRHTGRDVVELLQQRPGDSPVESLFRLPHDRHPSQAGMEFYAEAIFRVLLDRDVLR